MHSSHLGLAISVQHVVMVRALSPFFSIVFRHSAALIKTDNQLCNSPDRAVPNRQQPVLRQLHGKAVRTSSTGRLGHDNTCSSPGNVSSRRHSRRAGNTALSSPSFPRERAPSSRNLYGVKGQQILDKKSMQTLCEAAHTCSQCRSLLSTRC